MKLNGDGVGYSGVTCGDGGHRAIPLGLSEKDYEAESALPHRDSPLPKPSRNDAMRSVNAPVSQVAYSEDGDSLS